MSVNELHKITTALRAKKQGNIEVMIDFASFQENENGNILMIDDAKVKNLQGADDSGPRGKKFPMLVLSGYL